MINPILIIAGVASIYAVLAGKGATAAKCWQVAVATAGMAAVAKYFDLSDVSGVIIGGFGILFAMQEFVPEKIEPVLGGWAIPILTTLELACILVGLIDPYGFIWGSR